MRVLVLSGPNLNLLGTREPEVYGSATLADLQAQVTAWGAQLGIETSFTQSNSEGGLVEAIQGATGMDGLVINPGALTHTSRSIGDAIRGVGAPAVEVHISNVKDREPWRSTSLVSESCVRTIYGRGVQGYRDALRHLANRAALPFRTVRYGPHPENVGDLRMPAHDTLGLVALVHGGFWLRQYERDSMETLAVDLARKGFSTFNLEYRRLGTGGGWPGSAHDVLSALRSIGQIPELASLAVAVIGHSAGGYLALWAANRPRGWPVDLAVGLAPVIDLAALARSAGSGAGPAARLLEHGAPERVKAVPHRTLLVHGVDDDVVPLSHSRSLGAETELRAIDGMGHFAVLDPSGEHWPPVLDAIEAAFTRPDRVAAVSRDQAGDESEDVS